MQKTEYPYLINTLPAKDESARNALRFISTVLSTELGKADFHQHIELPACDWEALFSCADRWLVAPLVYARLKQKQLDHLCPVDFIQALQAYHAANQQRNTNHRNILLEASSLLNEVGIVPTLLKGAHALVEKLPDHAERMISDIDLLVPEESIDLALNTLLKAGYVQEHKGLTHNNPTSHHLDPLFHPSGLGYLEIHRRPNHAELYPNLIETCFTVEQTLLYEQGDASFYILQSWQLLIYNQIHHFHDTASGAKSPSQMRQLAEQATLLSQLSEPDELAKQVDQTMGEQEELCLTQFALLKELFSVKLPDNLLSLATSKKAKPQVNFALKLLLGSPEAKKQARMKYRQQFIKNSINNLVNPRWLKDRAFNLEWYRSRPALFRTHWQHWH